MSFDQVILSVRSEVLEERQASDDDEQVFPYEFTSLYTERIVCEEVPGASDCSFHHLNV